MEEIEGGNEAVVGSRPVLMWKAGRRELWCGEGAEEGAADRSGGGWLRAVVLAAAIGGRMERKGWSAHGG